MHGYKFLRSAMARETVSEELRVILDALPDGDRRLRKVQILVPQSPKVYAVIDPEDLDVMSSRTYRQPVVYPGQVIEFWLAPDQRLAAAAHQGFAETTLIIEFYEAGGR